MNIPSTGRTLRRLAALAVAVGTLGTAQAIFAVSPASAAPNTHLVEGTTANTSDNFKNLRVRCPTGEKVFGTAWDIANGLGQVAVNTVQPEEDLTSVLFEANEVGAGITSNWRMVGQVICGTPVASMQRVPNSALTGIASSKSVTTTCPGTLKVYGAGFTFPNGYGEVFLNFMIPNLSSSSNVFFSANNDDNNALSWGLTGWAICGAQSAGQTVVTGGGFANDSTSPKTTSVSCPNNTKLTGTGVTMNGGGTSNHDLVIEDLAITAALTGGQAKAFENDSTSEPWFVTPSLICA